MGNQLWSGLQFLLTSPAHSPAFYLPHAFCSSEINLPLSTSIPPLPLFLISTFYFYPIRTPRTLSSLLPLCLKRSQMLPFERQSRSVIFFFFFFQPLLQEVGPSGKKERGTREESRRVQGSTRRGETKMYYHLIPHVRGHKRSTATHTPCRDTLKTTSRDFLGHPPFVLAGFTLLCRPFFLKDFPSLLLHLHGCNDSSFLEAPPPPPPESLERGSRLGKRGEEGDGLHFRRNVVLELESE